MSGTREGGLKAAATNKRRYGQDFHRTIGRMGGKNVKPEDRGFARHPELARLAGQKGGRAGKGRSKKND